ncbi:MAG: hypothetical protein AAB444_01125 [Patescibacteria group bacterium]
MRDGGEEAKIYSFPDRGKAHREECRAVVEEAIEEIVKIKDRLEASEKERVSIIEVLQRWRGEFQKKIIPMEDAKKVLGYMRELRGLLEDRDASIEKLRGSLMSYEEGVARAENLDIVDEIL